MAQVLTKPIPVKSPGASADKPGVLPPPASLRAGCEGRFLRSRPPYSFRHRLRPPLRRPLPRPPPHPPPAFPPPPSLACRKAELHSLPDGAVRISTAEELSG